MTTRIRGSADVQTGTIYDAQIADDAAIAWEKLGLAGAAGALISPGIGQIPVFRPLLSTDIPPLAYEPAFGTLGVAKGGTGLASVTVGDLLYASGPTTLSKLADVAVGSVLVSGGIAAAPAWSQAPGLRSVTFPLVPTAADGLFIGSPTPTRLLHYYYDPTTDAHNLFVGEDAGNVTLAQVSSFGQASNNVGVGFQSLKSITTGYFLTGVGIETLQFNTTGFYNSAGGAKALNHNTIGNNNSAWGAESLALNTVGNDNFAGGAYSLNVNLSGNRNVVVGAWGGVTEVPANANISGSGNVWIGYQSGPGTSTQLDDSIGIGEQAHPTASHQAVFGGATITATVLRGAVTGLTTIKTSTAFLGPGSVATTGAIRLGSGSANQITFLNNAGNANVGGMYYDSGDVLNIGDVGGVRLSGVFRGPGTFVAVSGDVRLRNNGGGLRFGHSNGSTTVLGIDLSSANVLTLGDGVVPMLAQVSRLMFTDATSASPALKASGTTLQCRLATDGGYAPFDAGSYKVGGVDGVSYSGVANNITVVNGLVTSVN